MSGLYSSQKVLQLVFDQPVNPDEFSKYGEVIELKDNALKLMIDREQYGGIIIELIDKNKNLINISITNVPFKIIVHQVMAKGRIA